MANAAAAAPERSCRVCRARHPKSQLMRWVWRGSWLQDASQVMVGRGAYTCSPACAAKLPKLRPLASRSRK